MNSIIIDDCLYHLMEAEKCMKDYQELDIYTEIFEATDPKTAVQLKRNEKAISGTTNHLKAAFNAIIQMIRNLISSITDFFQKRLMKDSERQAYEDFKAACKNNPELANKKITVMDFRKFNKEYEQLLAEAEDTDRKLATGQDTPVEEIIKKMTEFCGGAAKGAMTAVGCEVALNYASSSREAAQKMLNVLKTDEQVHQQIVDAIGKKEAKKFEKSMAALGKRATLRRKIMQMKGTASKSFEDAVLNTFKEVESIAKGASSVAGKLPANDPSKSKAGNLAATAKAVWQNKGEVVQAGKQIAKGSSLIQRVMGNEEINQGVKGAMDMSAKAQQAAREQYKDSVKKPKKKKFRLEDQSMTDALLGRHDPNSVRNSGASKLRRFVDKRKK